MPNEILTSSSNDEAEKRDEYVSSLVLLQWGMIQSRISSSSSCGQARVSALINVRLVSSLVVEGQVCGSPSVVGSSSLLVAALEDVNSRSRFPAQQTNG